jgi:hypothetical protein
MESTAPSGTQPHENEHTRRAARFQAVFNTPAGGAVLDDLKAFARYGQGKIGEDAAGRVDPGKSLVFCGMETVLIYILDQLAVDLGAGALPEQAEMGDA